MIRILPALCLLAVLSSNGALSAPVASGDVRVKDLGRFLGWRDNALVGYGLVTGLSGSGDSPHSNVTQQALSNVLSRLGANVPAPNLDSRNVAAVMVTATLPPTTAVGDQIDVTVTSIGDARSLAGGTLLMTQLLGADQRPYALAQGSLVVGGYNFRDNGNVRQKNYPTSGVIVGGASVETAVTAELLDASGHLTFVLNDPDFTTAQRVADGLNAALGPGTATARGAETVAINVIADKANLTRLIAEIESVAVRPDLPARVVINERSGTVVAGGSVQISSVVIAQGDIKVSVDAEHDVLQPYFGGRPEASGRGLVVTNSALEVSDTVGDTVVKLPNTTVADLARALARAKVDTRSTIEILQAIKAAGALHAEIVVQ
jgi:flagellar P-ring protein precursor FlgI